MEMAAANGEQVTATEVADRYGISPTVTAKVFQQLVHAQVAVGTRGAGGGYQLARPASELTMLDVIQVFEPPREPGGCLLHKDDLPCAHPHDCRLRSIFDEVDELVRCTFASITLETLVGSHSPLERGVLAD